ncbi:membrane protein [Streptomyces durhamensis]|uniref:membrane protein n=1 Tax=Streptomyces durhamensis TaxID=68194 RepID=UPI0004CD1EC2|nr:membrane protein [Streptomyces durhamensis]
MTRSLRRDLYAAGAAVLLVTAAVVVGRHIQDTRHTLFVHWPPVLAEWDPHIGPGTPAALAVAAALVAYGPAVAARLPWRGLLAAAWASALAWILSLALIDGWHQGVAVRLTTREEYLRVIGRFHDIPATLRDFTHHIVSGTPHPWPAHVAGHPPAATLTFVVLDRIGLRGGGWAGMWCVTVGATGCVAVLIAIRALADETLARRAAPFLVLAPAAVWQGTSADGYFAAVAAWTLALFALALTRRSHGYAAASGLLFGLTCYLSYGLTLFALIGAAVLALARSGLRERPMLLVSLLAGLAVLPVTFGLAGFDWWTAYHLLVTRYYQGVGGTRPYGYWIWADLACTALITGPATAAGLRRTTAALLPRTGLRPPAAPLHSTGAGRAASPSPGPLPTTGRQRRAAPLAESTSQACAAPLPATGRRRPADARLALLVSAALLALLVADLSGMSKAETERIWLPFALWLLPACALLPHPRAWLTAQAVLALLLNHLLLTGW